MHLLYVSKNILFASFQMITYSLKHVDHLTEKEAYEDCFQQLTRLDITVHSVISIYSTSR